MRNKQKFLKSKKWWIVLLGFLALLGLGYGLFFTSPLKLSVQPSPESIQIIGSPASYQESVRSMGIAGSKDLCWTPPECEQVMEKGKDGWDLTELENLSDFEKKCLFDCLPHPDSPWAGERETITILLTGSQVTQLIAAHLPPNHKVSDLIVDISGETLYFQAVSSYPFLPGKVTGELLRENYRYQLKSLYAGRVPVPQRIQKSIEENLDAVVIDALASYGVALLVIKIEDDKLIVTAEIPKGLVIKEDDRVIINFEILPIPTPKEPDEDFRIPDKDVRIQ